MDGQTPTLNDPLWEKFEKETSEIVRDRNIIHAKAALFDEMLVALNMVQERWSFNSQQHTHTWHDWADCQAIIKPLLTKANKIAEGG